MAMQMAMHCLDVKLNFTKTFLVASTQHYTICLMSQADTDSVIPSEHLHYTWEVEFLGGARCFEPQGSEFLGALMLFCSQSLPQDKIRITNPGRLQREFSEGRIREYNDPFPLI